MKQIVLYLMLALYVQVKAQTVLTWADLKNGISFEKKASNDTYPSFYKATFSSKLADLEGQKIQLTGFFIVLDGPLPVYMLSVNPMASCFFCGNGGPESIAGLSFTKKPDFTMDDVVTITGILRLNGKDPTRCYYEIEKAEAYGF